MFVKRCYLQSSSVSTYSFVLIMLWIFSITCGAKIKKYNLKSQECLQRATYVREQKKFKCKDLGACYKHYCMQIARRCNNCKESRNVEVPCAVNRTQHGNLTKNPSKLRSTKAKREKSDFFKIPVLIINSGNVECFAFLAKLSVNQKTSYVLFTAAHCLINFAVRCTSSYTTSENTTDQQRKHHLCFGRKIYQVNSVKKGFRSYGASISHRGNQVNIGVNSKTVLVPRQYVECGDCRFDFAVIPLKVKYFRKLNLHKEDVFKLGFGSKKRILRQKVKMPMINLQKEKTKRSQKTHAVKISGVKKFKICLDFKYFGNKATRILPGSPVAVATRYGLSAIGIVTHYIKTLTKRMSNTTLPNDEVYRHQEMSAVRVTKLQINFVGKWLKGLEDRTPFSTQLHSRYDCYPSFPKPYTNQTLCICGKGWNNERNLCNNNLNEVQNNECKWKSQSKTVKCQNVRQIPKRKNRPYSRVIPGNTENLSLVDDVTLKIADVQEILRRVPKLKILLLECNQLKKIPWKSFKYGRKLVMVSLRKNSINWIDSGTFRKNRNLMSLSISSNALSKLDSRLLYNQRQLYEIDLSYNMLLTLKSKSFLRLKRMEKIRLGYNRLSTIPPSIFSHNKRLHEIWLQYNMITSLNSQVFKSCTLLRYVNLEGNHLRTLSANIFADSKYLTSINLKLNKIMPIRHYFLDEKYNICQVDLYDKHHLSMKSKIKYCSNRRNCTNSIPLFGAI